jgi:hypothetical protein
MREACTALAAPMALRSMQGICTRPPMGSQVMPRLCSMAISAACSIWPSLPPSAAVKSARGHGAGHAHFALATDLRAADRCVLLVKNADRRRSEKEAHDAFASAGNEALIVERHGGNHAGSAVGGRGDHAAAGCVLLVHRHGVDRHPVERRQRIACLPACVACAQALGQDGRARRRTSGLRAEFLRQPCRAPHRPAWFARFARCRPGRALRLRFPVRVGVSGPQTLALVGQHHAVDGERVRAGVSSSSAAL